MKATTIRTAVLASTLALMLTACGSSDSGTGGGGASTLTAAQQTEATQMMQSVFNTGNAASGAGGPSAMTVEKEIIPMDCPTSGNMVIDTEAMTIEWDECVSSYDSTTYEMDGIITMVQSGDTTTLTYDNLSVTTTDSSGTNTFTMDGTIAATEASSTESTIETNISSTFGNGDAFTMVGSITETENASGDAIMNGSFTITIGAHSATCTFANFNTETATDADFASACGF